MSTSPRTAALLAVLVFSSLLAVLVIAQGSGDGGTGGDASNSKSSPTPLTLPSIDGQTDGARYTGKLSAGNDNEDNYRISIPDLNDGFGPRVFEVLLLSYGNADYKLELYEGPAGATFRVAGSGPSGTRALRFSENVEPLVVRIFSDPPKTGSYEFWITVSKEKDAFTQGLQYRDARDATNNQGGFHLSSTAATYYGNLTRGDTGDAYSFSNPTDDVDILIVATFPHNSNLKMTIFPPTPGPTQVIPPTIQVREGPGMITGFVAGALSGVHVVRLEPDSAGKEGPYSLAIKISPAAGQDLGSANDAPSSFGTAMTLPPGVHLSRLNEQSPTQTGDLADYYKMTGLKAGQILRIGAASHEPDATIKRPIIFFTLYNHDRQVVQSVSPCGEAGSSTVTVPKHATAATQTWYLAVEEAYNDPSKCTALDTDREGWYSLFYLVSDQEEALPLGDAGSSVADAAQAVVDSPTTAWMDSTDSNDWYRIGSVPAGGVIRAVVFGLGQGMEFKVSASGQGGVVLLGSVTSSGGVAGLQLSTTTASDHYMKIEHLVGGSANAGQYRFYVRSGPNEAPAPVTLEDTIDTEVKRTSVPLKWTQSFDTDFARYEVHGSLTAGFAPSASTLRGEAIENPATTFATVAGLEPGKTYQFLIRVVDQGGLTADSNRITETTKAGAIGNTRPSLTEHSHSPGSGSPDSTVFTFQVKYTDSDNEVPTRKLVYIDNKPKVMSSTDTSYDNGAVFTLQTTLPAGRPPYYFEFSDGDSDVRDPLVDAYQGPEVAGEGNRPPSVQASGAPREGEAPLKVQFSATATDPDGHSVSYSWDFDNQDGITSQSSQQNPEYTYETPGLYHATVTVKDSEGSTSSALVSTNVREPSNAPPTVAPTAAPSSGKAPLKVRFDAHAKDSDGTIVSYVWDFDNSDGLQEDSKEAAPEATYTKAGSYSATVTATDNKGAKATGSVTVVVSTEANNPPSIIIDASPSAGAPPLEVSFVAQVVDADNDPVTIAWDFDTSDGIQTEATGEATIHTFAQAGTYTVLATATDDDGATATSSLRIRVSGAGGDLGTAALFIEADPKKGKAPLTVKFSAKTDDLSAPPASYSWSFGDASAPSTDPTPTHTFEKVGKYLVSLNVTDQNGAVYESTIEINATKGSPGPSMAALILGILALVGFLARRGRTPER